MSGDGAGTKHDRLVRMYCDQIIIAVRDNDDDTLRLFAECLAMADETKQVLKDKGYGWTGLDLLQTAKQVPEVLT